MKVSIDSLCIICIVSLIKAETSLHSCHESIRNVPITLPRESFCHRVVRVGRQLTPMFQISFVLAEMETAPSQFGS